MSERSSSSLSLSVGRLLVAVAVFLGATTLLFLVLNIALGRHDSSPDPLQTHESRGSAQTTAAVVVPDVVGLPVGDAVRRLNELGLSAKVETQLGVVKNQVPAAGSRLASGTLVLLQVA